MGNEITIKHECDACKGTGLYVGMAERDGAAIVCHMCDGTGWRRSVFREFTGRKEKKGVIRVFQTNPGIVIGDGVGGKLSDFGGIPVEDWIHGEPFHAGTEMRMYTCPRWWAQCVNGVTPNWSECASVLGRRFSDCKNFRNNEACWDRWDRENGKVVLDAGPCRITSKFRVAQRRLRREASLATTGWAAPTTKGNEMTHIDDWLDDPTTGPTDVKEWLEHFRRPAIDKDYKWLSARKLFCTYKDGKRYRCIGCSRMGDVWLTKHFERENGYDLRIDIDDCTDWEVTPNVKVRGCGDD